MGSISLALVQASFHAGLFQRCRYLIYHVLFLHRLIDLDRSVLGKVRVRQDDSKQVGFIQRDVGVFRVDVEFVVGDQHASARVLAVYIRSCIYILVF